uniref:Uncharacterized protein n=1 Tax=Callorhinchus milii TaxID=7868 RepID=A0A4W3IWJ2_CALMI
RMTTINYICIEPFTSGGYPKVLDSQEFGPELGVGIRAVEAREIRGRRVDEGTVEKWVLRRVMKEAREGARQRDCRIEFQRGLWDGVPKGRSPVWTRWCCRKLEDWVKVLPHSEHRYGLSPVCRCRCRERLEEFLNGRSPVWTRWCCRKLEDWVKVLPHSEHRYGLSPVCCRTWYW